MKKREVKTIFENDTIRRNKIFRYILLALGSLIIACVLLTIFVSKNQVQYAKYDESSSIDYQVYLKNNNFFKDNYLASDKQYISTLIDYINAKFNYKLTLEENNVEYKYSYKIDAEVKVTDKETKKVVYTFTDNLIPIKDLEGDEKVLIIDENVKIDYNHYNDIIKKFIATYDLTSVESTLNVKATVNVVGSCEELNENKTNESVMNLSIPLTQKTMALDITNQLVNTEDNLMICSRPSPLNYIILIIAFIFVVLSITTFVNMIIYYNNSRTAKNIFDKELKKILSNYGPYIQKVDGTFALKGYQSVKIESFTDMLEIRDSLNTPILMSTSDEAKSTYFFILDVANNAIYIYGLRVKEIQRQIDNTKE